MPALGWRDDHELGADFQQLTLALTPDYDGQVTATLVRSSRLLPPTKAAILYVHGFIDYFFQRHVADRFKAAGHNFYGLDLRKYGRSLNGAARPNICLAFEEYFEEITQSLDIIASDGHSSAVLMAHSTGALPAALYAKGGKNRDFVRRLIFNSPFLEFPHRGAGVLAWLGQWLPFHHTDNRINPWYAKSLHEDYKGEWKFNTAFKPIQGFCAYYGWIRAVVLAQKRIKAGLGLTHPVLVLHSDKSADDEEWSEQLHRADLVLRVTDIKKLAPKLGTRVVLKAIEDGKHDLTLSLEKPREQCLEAMVQWAGTT